MFSSLLLGPRLRLGSCLKAVWWSGRQGVSLSARRLPVRSGVTLTLTVIGSGLGAKLWLAAPVHCELSVPKVKPKGEPNIPFNWSCFWRLLLDHIWLLLFTVASSLAVASLDIVIPMQLGQVVNVLGGLLKDSGSQELAAQLKLNALKLLGLHLAQSAMSLVYISSVSALGEALATQMRSDLFNALLTQDIAFFDTARTAELMDSLTSDVQEFKSSFKQLISQGIQCTIKIIGGGVSLFLISRPMARVVVVVLPSVILVGTLLGRLLRSISHRAQVQMVRAVTFAEDAIINIRTVRAFASESREADNFKKEISLAGKYQTYLGLGIATFEAGTRLFLASLVVGTLYLGGTMIRTEEMSAGSLMSFLVALQKIQGSMAKLSVMMGQAVRGKQAGAKVFQLTCAQPTIPISGGDHIPYHSLVPAAQFNKVSFTYPSRPGVKVLDGLDLDIPAGKTVAIVGASGNGKSTIAALLERFYDVEGGQVVFSGRDIRHLDPKWLRGSALALINQEPVLFATTIRENIRYGRPQATNSEVEEAARQANAHDFITAFPQGYDTVLGERGVTVSGGQKQRLAIARALLKQPSLLILDEATSALDPESEQTVQATLERVCRGKTVLVISHRLTTVQNADVIIVLDKGRIVERGTHAELCRAKGHYYKLMSQQERDRRQA